MDIGNYGDHSYWISRYLSQKDTTFDWLQDYASIKPIIEKMNIPKDTSRILNIGCGNSELGEKMLQDNYEHIYNIDNCDIVITNMKDLFKAKRKGIYYDVMDVRDMKYKNDMFDLVIDKATMDTLLCGEHPFLNVARMLKEVSRVLKEGGYYLLLSYGKPEDRLIHLKRDFLAFDIDIYTIKRKEVKKNESSNINNNEENENGNNSGEKEKEKEKDSVHYGYICKKLKEAEKYMDNFDKICQEIENQENKGNNGYNSKNNKYKDNDNNMYIEKDYYRSNKYSNKESKNKDTEVMRIEDSESEDNKEEIKIKEKEEKEKMKDKDNFMRIKLVKKSEQRITEDRKENYDDNDAFSDNSNINDNKSNSVINIIKNRLMPQITLNV